MAARSRFTTGAGVARTAFASAAGDRGSGQCAAGPCPGAAAPRIATLGARLARLGHGRLAAVHATTATIAIRCERFTRAP
jgi:hypothetical protein